MATVAGRGVSGDLSATGAVGPYQPLANCPFNVFITGTFVAVVEVQRSFDKGVSYSTMSAPDFSAVAQFTAPANFQVSESDAAILYQVAVTDWTSGTVSIRIG